MSLEQFWTIIGKQWRLIIMCFLIVGLGAFIGSKLMTPIYQSSALVQVAIRSSNTQADYTSLLASDQLVQTEASLAISYPVLHDVVTGHYSMTVQQLTNEVTSSAKLNTQLFEIDVTDPSPTRAAALANDIAQTLIFQQALVIQKDNSTSQTNAEIELGKTQQEIDSITKQIATLQAKGGKQAQVAVLQAKLYGLQQHYSLLSQLALTQVQNGDFLRVVQPAQPGSSPVRPSILLNTGGGLLAGLLLGLLLAILFESLDTRVRTPEALTQLLEWPTLATIFQSKSSNREDLINPSGQDDNVEPYRILRTNIGFSAIDKPMHTLLVTSAVPRDGKSITTANLAIFMAKAGKNTLLIDADLRRPTQHMLFNLPTGSVGLSNAVMTFGTQTNTNTASYNQFFATPSSNPSLQALHASKTYSSWLGPFVHSVGIPNLWVMPSGPLPPNPSELLDSKAMKRFLTIIENCGVEVVIFDSPPILGLSDASILASKVDGALVVVDISRANKGKLKQLKAVLSKTGVNVLGCVINKQRKNRHDNAYTYYYYLSEQQEDGKSAKNGNTPPPIPISPTSSWSPSKFDQGMRSN